GRLPGGVPDHHPSQADETTVGPDEDSGPGMSRRNQTPRRGTNDTAEEPRLKPERVDPLVEADEEPGEDGGKGVESLRASVPGELSLLPLRDNVLFPAVVAPLTVTREGSVKLIEDASVTNARIIGVVTLRDP